MIPRTDVAHERARLAGLATKSDIGHNHDDRYVRARVAGEHNHDGEYSPIDHDHDGEYSPIGHDHDGDYEPADAALQAHLSDTSNPHEVPLGTGGGLKNILINGEFRVNQRGFSGNWSSVGLQEYGYDRWRRSQTGGYIEQPIEYRNLHNGYDYTLSWTGGGSGLIVAASSAVASGTSPITGTNVSWARNDASDYVRVPTGSSYVQLEIGAAASDFEFRDYGLDLLLSQRYFFANSSPTFGVGEKGSAAASSLMAGEYIVFPVTMRATPTGDADGVTYSNCTYASTILSPYDMLIRVSTTGVANYRMYGGSYTFDAEIG